MIIYSSYWHSFSNIFLNYLLMKSKLKSPINNNLYSFFSFYSIYSKYFFNSCNYKTLYYDLNFPLFHYLYILSQYSLYEIFSFSFSFSLRILVYFVFEFVSLNTVPPGRWILNIYTKIPVKLHFNFTPKIEPNKSIFFK